MSLCSADCPFCAVEPPTVLGELRRAEADPPRSDAAALGRPPFSTGRVGAVAVAAAAVSRSLPGIPRSGGIPGGAPDAEVAGAAAGTEAEAEAGSGAVGGRGEFLRPFSDEFEPELSRESCGGRPPRGEGGLAPEVGRGEPLRGPEPPAPGRGDESRPVDPLGEPDRILIWPRSAPGAAGGRCPRRPAPCFEFFLFVETALRVQFGHVHVHLQLGADAVRVRTYHIESIIQVHTVRKYDVQYNCTEYEYSMELVKPMLLIRAPCAAASPRLLAGLLPPARCASSHPREDSSYAPTDLGARCRSTRLVINATSYRTGTYIRVHCTCMYGTVLMHNMQTYNVAVGMIDCAPVHYSVLS